VHFLVANVALALAIALPAGLIPGPAAAVPPVLVLGALIALLPDRRSLLAFRPSAPLLALSLAGAAGLAMYAADQLHLQHVLPHTEPHAAVRHWAGMALFAATLAVVAVVTALRPVGWRLGLWIAGGVTAFFGVASGADPTMPSSLGLAWGAVAVAGSVAFVAVGERIARR
jgi:hypothetical protein